MYVYVFFLFSRELFYIYKISDVLKCLKLKRFTAFYSVLKLCTNTSTAK